MDEVKKLQEKLKKAFSALKELSANIDKADGDEAKEKAREEHKAKYAEVQELKVKLDDAIKTAEEEKAINASLRSAQTMTTVAPPAGGTLTSGGAEPRDHDKELRAKEDIFLKYMSDGAKALSGEEYRAVNPSEASSRFSEKTEGGVVVPRSFVLSMFGTKWAQSMGWTKADIQRIAKASTMVSSTDALGGYTVPEDFRPTLLQLPTEMPHLIDRVTVVPAPTGEVTMPKAKQTDSDEYGGMVGDWIEEGGLKTKADTRFEQVKISTHEYAMYTQISLRLLNRSAIAMESWLSTRGRQVAMDALDQAIISGDGDSKPLGILETDGIRELARTTDGTVVRKDTVNLKYQLKPYHRSGAIFVMDDTVLQALEALEDNEGRPLFSASMANGPFDRLAGYPFIVTTRTPNIGTDGDLIFIDPREYYLPMEQDMVIKRSDDYDIVHNVATIVMFMIAGGQLVQPRVCSILGNETSS